MNATNHAAVGAIIGFTLKEPVLVLPLAFASHFALDALPHFGYRNAGLGDFFSKKLTRLELVFLGVGLSTLGVLLASSSWLVLVAALVAVSPDFIWIYRYYFLERKGLAEPGEGTILDKFHNKIQWCERPWGIVIEVILSAALLYAIYRITT